MVWGFLQVPLCFASLMEIHTSQHLLPHLWWRMTVATVDYVKWFIKKKKCLVKMCYVVLIFNILFVFSFSLLNSGCTCYLWRFTLNSLWSALSWTHFCLLQLWTALVVQAPGKPNFGMGCLPVILAGLCSPSHSSWGRGGRIKNYLEFSYFINHIAFQLIQYFYE